MQTIAGHCYCGRGDRGLRQQLCCVGGRGVVQSGRKQNHQIESPAVNTMSVRLSASDRQFTLIAIFVHSTGPDQTSSIASQYPLVGISHLNVAGLLGQVRHASRCGHIPQLSSKSTLTEELGTTGLGLQSRECRRYFPLHFITCPMWFFRRDNEIFYLTMAQFNFNAGLCHL